jgi:hypothetical protein
MAATLNLPQIQHLEGNNVLDQVVTWLTSKGKLEANSKKDIIGTLIEHFKPKGLDNLTRSSLTSLFMLNVNTSTKYGDGLASEILRAVFALSSMTKHLELPDIARKWTTPEKSTQLLQIVKAEKTKIVELTKGKQITGTIGSISVSTPDESRPLVNCLLNFNDKFDTEYQDVKPDINEWGYVQTLPAFTSSIKQKLGLGDAISFNPDYTITDGSKTYTIRKNYVGLCWICKLRIYVWYAIGAIGKPVTLTSPGEWEHSVPPGVGNMVGFLFPTVNEHAEFIKKTYKIIYLLFAILPAHVFCNQLKNALVFLTFISMICGIYDEAVEEFMNRVRNRLGTKQHGYLDPTPQFKLANTEVEKKAAEATMAAMKANVREMLGPLAALVNEKGPQNKTQQKSLYNQNNVILTKTLIYAIYILGKIVEKTYPEIYKKFAEKIASKGKKAGGGRQWGGTYIGDILDECDEIMDMVQEVKKMEQKMEQVKIDVIFTIQDGEINDPTFVGFIKTARNTMAEWYPKRSLPSLRIPPIPQSVRAQGYRRPSVQSPKYKSGRPVYTRSSPVPDITTKFHSGINHTIFSNKRGKLRRKLIIKTLNNARRAARNFTLLQRRARPAAPAGQVGPVRPIPASADVENLLPAYEEQRHIAEHNLMYGTTEEKAAADLFLYGPPGESPAAASAMSLSLIPHVQLLPTKRMTRKELNEEKELRRVWGSLVRPAQPAQPWRLGGKRTAKHRKRNKTKKNKR